MRKEKKTSLSYKRVYHRKYRHTLPGLISDIYDKMRQRCVRGDTLCAHLYKGKTIPKADEFRKHAYNSVKLTRLFTAWRRGGFKLVSRPTPDRIDVKQGYELWNIRFLTFSDNIRLSRRNGKRKKRCVK